MNISVPLFSQRDTKWASKKLGTGAGTIGGVGCLLTCLAMDCKYFGKDTDPDKLNQELTKVGGYTDGNLYSWYNGITKIYPDIKITKLVDTPNNVTKAQFDEIKAELDAGRPVILQVDFYPSTVQPDMHFVLLIGYEGSNYFVADPWFGDISNLSRYGKPEVTILKYAFHSGPLPQTPADDPCADIKQDLADVRESRDKWKSDFKELETKYDEQVTKYTNDMKPLVEANQRLTEANQLANVQINDLKAKLVQKLSMFSWLDFLRAKLGGDVK